ncbi:hypothetical protein [Soonwooa purpurea]
MTKLILLFFVLFFQFFSSQNSSIEKVDVKLKESHDAFAKIKLLESLKKANEALEVSEKISYSNGIIKSNIFIAKVLLETRQYAKSLEYIKKAESHLDFESNKEMVIETHRIKGLLYSYLKFDSKADLEFRKQLEKGRLLTDEYKKNLVLLWGYQNLSELYQRSHNRDSALVNLNRARVLLSNFEPKNEAISYITVYNQLSKVFIEENKIDSAQFYLTKSKKMLDEYQIPYSFSTDEIYGLLYSKLGDFEKAILHYESALHNAQKLGMPNVEQELHLELSQIYKSKNRAKFIDHYEKYQALNSLYENDNKRLNVQVLDYLLEKEKGDSQKLLWKYWALGGLLLFFMIIYFLYNRKTLNKYKMRLREKRKVISNSSLRIQELEGKILDNNFEELINLAKKNAPEFFIIFSETYPEFVDALKKSYPQLTSSELSFCAMLYMNFSSKDIAEYTFVTLRAVQIRKNRLRKKLYIDSNIDLYQWIRALA